MGAALFPELSSIESPATPLAMQSFTFAATSSGSSANPFKKSAFTGSGVAATTSPMCESISSSETPPSGLPREKAKPADVVASASKPRCCRYRAVPTFHGLGRTKQPDSCIVVNLATADDCEFGSFIFAMLCWKDANANRVVQTTSNAKRPTFNGESPAPAAIDVVGIFGK